MIRPAKRYSKVNLGYYLDKPEPVLGGYDRSITLLLNAADTRYTGASFLSDPWFIYIAGATTHKSIYINDNPKSVNRCLTANSRLDDDLLRRYGFRLMLPDLLADYKELGDIYGTELLNDAFADMVKEIFETKREAYSRIYAVINEEYEPLFNLDVTYVETHSGTDTEGIDTTQDSTREKDGSDSLVKTGSDTTTYSGSETTQDNNGSQSTTNTYTYAFNSSDPVPEGKSITDYAKSETKSFTGRNDQLQHNTTDTTNYGSEETESATIATDRSFTHGEKITTRRYGNQGITKSTELVMDQINTWNNIDFIRYVTDDIAHQISII